MGHPAAAKSRYTHHHPPHKLSLAELLGLQPLLRFYESVGIEAVSVQAAVFDEVTYMKVLGSGAKHAYAKTKGAAKWLADFAGIKNRIDASPAKSTSELVIERSKYWSNRPAETVRKHVLQALASNLKIDPSDIGLLSTRLIEEAAEGYGISSEILLSQQAEAVAEAYLKDCIEGVQEHLRKQNSEEIRLTEGVLAQRLAEMTPAERLAIQKALNLENLSASSLRSAFLTSGLPLAGIAAVQVGGFGAYLVLTTMMHAVFTSMLGIALPFAAYTSATSALSFLAGPAGVLLSLSIGMLGYFWGQRKIERSQYAMIVWTCVMHGSRPLVPPTSLLPSAQRFPLLPNGSNGLVETPAAEKDDFQNLEEERGRNLQAVSEFNAAKRDSAKAEEHVRSLERRLRRAEELLASVTAKSNSDSALQEALKAQIQIQHREISRLSAELKSAEADAASAKECLNRKERAHAEADGRFVSRLERRSREIEALWGVHFPKFSFHPQPLRWAAGLDFPARIEIERALKELADAPDPAKLNRSKMHTGDLHSRFVIPKGVECRMFYRTKGGRVEVSRMCKKKDCE